MEEYRVKKPLVQMLLNYLQEQPYRDVYGLINALMACKLIEKEEE